MSSTAPSRFIVRKTAADAAAEAAYTHPLNPAARRRSISLGDATGLTLLGVHLTVIAPGDLSTESHRHEFCDEFIFVLSGSGEVQLDDVAHEIHAGDFIGFPANAVAHVLRNTGAEDLVYLLGGGRPSFDVCHYPRLDKRLYLHVSEKGRWRDFVDNANLDQRGP